MDEPYILKKEDYYFTEKDCTALTVLLDVLNYYWFKNKFELWPYKNIGSKQPWYLGDLWQELSKW